MKKTSSSSPASRGLYSYDAETHTATCRTRWTSEGDLLPEEAGAWHAGHQSQCAGTPAERPQATILPFRRPTISTQQTRESTRSLDGTVAAAEPLAQAHAERGRTDVTAAAGPPYATAQRIGSRSHQCDATAVASFEGTVAHVLLDGMGCSDEIAQWTQATAVRLADTAARMGDADAALRQVHAGAAAEPGRAEHWLAMPRAVAVAALFRPGAPVQIAWCGDARAYRRGLDGVVHRVTDDHNARQDAIDRGLPGGDRHKVLSFLGDPRPSPRLGARSEPAEGLFLLISDGGYEPLEEMGCELWAHLLGPLDEVADDLAAFAAVGDGADNATVVVIDLSPGHEPPHPGAGRV